MFAALCILLLVLPAIVISFSLHPSDVPLRSIFKEFYHFLSTGSITFAILNLGIIAIAALRPLRSASRLALLSAGCFLVLQVPGLFSMGNVRLSWKLWYWLLAGSNFGLLVVAGAGIAKEQSAKRGLAN